MDTQIMKLKLTKEAEKALKTGKSLSVGSPDGFWYDLTLGGYFYPEDVLSDNKEIQQVKEALKLLQQLEDIYNGVVPEF
jgi:hypothetical protein